MSEAWESSAPANLQYLENKDVFLFVILAADEYLDIPKKKQINQWTRYYRYIKTKQTFYMLCQIPVKGQLQTGTRNCQTLGLVLRLRVDFVLPLSQEEQEEQEQEQPPTKIYQMGVY